MFQIALFSFSIHYFHKVVTVGLLISSCRIQIQLPFLPKSPSELSCALLLYQAHQDELSYVAWDAFLSWDWGFEITESDLYFSLAVILVAELLVCPPVACITFCKTSLCLVVLMTLCWRTINWLTSYYIWIHLSLLVIIMGLYSLNRHHKFKRTLN